MESLEKRDPSESKFEVLKTPEILIQKEPGIQLLSLLLFAINPEEAVVNENPLAKEVADYFRDNPIGSDITRIIDSLNKEGVDLESLYNMALFMGHPERETAFFEMARKYKQHIENPQEKYQQFTIVLSLFIDKLSELPFINKIEEAVNQDMIKRLDKMDLVKKEINNLISFFKPDLETTDIRKIFLIPTDPFVRKNSGRAFIFEDELILKTHIDNLHNLRHEFLHSIINPIVEKLVSVLSSRQKDKIARLSGDNLKRNYGEGYYSLLCEELVRTYNDFFCENKRPKTLEDFRNQICGLSEEQLNKLWDKDGYFKVVCNQIGIYSLEDFKNKTEEYFDQYIKDDLRPIILDLYKDYEKVQNEPNQNFERFILEQLPGLV